MLLVLIIFLVGVFRYRFWEYWKWALLLPAWMLIMSVLFAGGGTLENPHGDGLISHSIRVATNDGPAMGLFGIAVLVLTWGPAVYFGRKMHKAVKNRENPRAEAQATPWPRKSFEAVMLLCAFFVYGMWAYAGMFQARQLQQAASQPSADGVDPVTVELEKAAQEVNASAPQKLDPITTLVGASVEGRTFVYHYTLSRREGTDEQLRSFLTKQIAPNTCTNKDQRPIMDEYGISYRYSYKFPDSASPVTFDVTSATCRALGK